MMRATRWQDAPAGKDEPRETEPLHAIDPKVEGEEK